MPHSGQRPNTTHNRQREPLQKTGLKDKVSRTQQQILDTLPESPGPGEQGTLHSKILQDLFFIKPLPLRTGDVADFSNTEKQAQRLRQNERTGRDTTRDLRETDTSNKPD